MRLWIAPLIIGLLLGIVAYHAALLATPYALMQLAMNRIGGDGKVNQFRHGELATAANQPIVRPSPDLAYSNCIFDIAEGPVLVDVAPVPGHYWSVSIFDARTDVAAVRSDRDTRGKPARLALASKGQLVPAGYERVELAYARGIILIRILLASREEFPSVDAIRRKSTCKRA
jgi:uncharacterized membrane protein